MPLGAPRPGDPYETIVRNLHDLASSARREARVFEACELFGRLVPFARECAQADYLAWVLLSWGEAAVFTGNYDVATPALEEASGLYQSLGDGGGQARCVFQLAQIAGNQGRADDAEALFVRSREISEKAGDRAGLATALRAQGEIAMWRGQPERAASLLLEARRAFVALADRYGEASVLQPLSRVEVALGRIQSAQKCLVDALALANAIGDPQLKANVLFHVGVFCADWRSADGAKAALDEALAAFQQTGDRLGQARCHATLATIYCRLNRYDEASTALATARELHLELGNVAAVAIVGTQLADVLVAQGKYAAAGDLYREHMRTIRQHSSVLAQGEALLGFSDALGKSGDVDAARVSLAEARTLLASVGDRSNLARADRIEGEVLIRAGREAEGMARIRRGLDRYDALGALGRERPETLAAKTLAWVERKMGDTQGNN
jgi:tetratricopeptide (TPR) repeat protein